MTDVRQRIRSGALTGLWTGLALAGLEAVAALPLVTGADRWHLLLHLAAWLPTACGIVGAALGAIGPGLLRLSRRIFPRSEPERALAWTVALLLVLPVVYVAFKLFSGGQMRRIGMRHFLWPAASILLSLGLAAAVTFAQRIAARWPDWTRGRRIAIGAALLLLAAALHGADLRLFPRLYGYLHAALAASTVAVAAFWVSLQRANRHPKAAFSAGAAALCLGLVVASGWTLDSRQTVRYVAFERTAIAKYVLRGVDRVLEVSGARPEMSREVRRAIYERELAARRAADRYPQVPGAHVILVTIDALRADHTGFSGGTKLTPNLDRLAKGAVVFDRTYCQAPHSSYSLTSLHTSEYQHELVELPHPPVLETLADRLGKAGYFTAAFYTRGIFHTEGERLTHYDDARFGFSVADHGNRRAEVITDRAIEEIDRIVSRGEPKFFLWMHYFDTHEPYRDTSLGTSPQDRYRAEVRNVDRELARLLNHVKRVVARDTVVAITADHGEEFREHGGHYHGSSLYDEQVRIPLVVVAPGARGRKVQQVVESVDIAPTLLRLVGVDPPSTMRGDDLRPLVFDGDGAMPALPAFGTVIQKKMVVSWPYKLIADFNYDVFELYDLSEDPAEQKNLYDLQREKADALKQEIYAWLDRVRQATRQSAAQNALALGRLGDRRAGAALAKIAASPAAAVEERVEAARLLGDLEDRRTSDALALLLTSEEEVLAVAAAAALASMDDARGRERLVLGGFSEDHGVRSEAALGLSALRDRRAVPGLVEALHAEDLRVRRDAIKALGLLRDTRGVEPLLEILPDTRVRYLVVLSLGMIGDPRSYATLMDLLDRETSVDIRGYAVAAFGWIRNGDALDRILRVFHEEPEHRWTSETLVRLGVVERRKAWGADVRGGAAALASGFGPCHEQPFFSFEVSEFLAQTWCETQGARATVRFDVSAPRASTLAIRLRHLGATGRSVQVRVSLNGRARGPIDLGDDWKETRVPLARTDLIRGANEILLESTSDSVPAPELGIDHVLVVPSP